MYEPSGFPCRREACRPTVPVRTREICSSGLPLPSVRIGRDKTPFAPAGAVIPPLLRLIASGETNLQETNALVWVMVAISAAGAIVTFAFLVYSLWRFRDPKVKNRRYG